MLPLRTEQVEGAKENIILDIVRGEETIHIPFDDAQQQNIFTLLRGPESSHTPLQVFNRVKADVQAQHNYSLRRSDLDIPQLVEMIGYLNKIWEDPRVFSVTFVASRPNGFNIRLPQDKTTQMIYINNSAQRFIHQESTTEDQTAAQIFTNITNFYDNQGILAEIPSEQTIRRLRHIIRERIALHPSSENAHWAMVCKPFSADDPITVIPKNLEQPSAPRPAATS